MLVFFKFRNVIMGVAVWGLALTGIGLGSLDAAAQVKPAAFSSAGLSAERQLPINISSEGLKTNPDASFAEFYGHVKVVQGEFVIQADRLKVYYRSDTGPSSVPSAEGQNIEKVVATGAVRIEADQRIATTERAEYTTASQILVLYGDGTRVEDGENTITGQKITIFRQDRRITVSRSDDRRVEAVLFTRAAKPALKTAPTPEPVQVTPAPVGVAPVPTPEAKPPVVVVPAPKPEPAPVTPAPVVVAPVPTPEAKPPVVVVPAPKPEPAPMTPAPVVVAPVPTPEAKPPVVAVPAPKPEPAPVTPAPVTPAPVGVAPVPTPESKPPVVAAPAPKPALAPGVLVVPVFAPKDPAETQAPALPVAGLESDVHEVDESLLSRWNDIKSIMPERWMPQLKYSGLSKQVALMGFEDRIQFKGFNSQALVQRVFFKPLQQTCQNIRFVLPGDPAFPTAVNQVPKLISGLPDNYEIALLARQSGANAVVSSALVEIRPIKVDRGVLMFRDRYDYVRVTVWLKVYDAYSGTKLMDQTFEGQTEIDEVDAQAIQKNEAITVPGLGEIVEEVLTEAAESLCLTLKKQPWHGFVRSVKGGRVVLSAGGHAGLKVGDTLAVWSDREITGAQGHRYFIPGPKSGEIRVVEISDSEAIAQLLTDSVIKPGDPVSLTSP